MVHPPPLHSLWRKESGLCVSVDKLIPWIVLVDMEISPTLNRTHRKDRSLVHQDLITALGGTATVRVPVTKVPTPFLGSSNSPILAIIRVPWNKTEIINEILKYMKVGVSAA